MPRKVPRNARFQCRYSGVILGRVEATSGVGDGDDGGGGGVEVVSGGGVVEVVMMVVS